MGLGDQGLNPSRGRWVLFLIGIHPELACYGLIGKLRLLPRSQGWSSNGYGCGVAPRLWYMYACKWLAGKRRRCTAHRPRPRQSLKARMIMTGSVDHQPCHGSSTPHGNSIDSSKYHLHLSSSSKMNKNRRKKKSRSPKKLMEARSKERCHCNGARMETVGENVAGLEPLETCRRWPCLQEREWALGRYR